jgi:hypothetical protein
MWARWLGGAELTEGRDSLRRSKLDVLCEDRNSIPTLCHPLSLVRRCPPRTR